MSQGGSFAFVSITLNDITTCEFASRACQKSIAPWGAGRWEMGRLGKQSSTGLSQSPGLFPLNPSYHIPTTEEEMLSCLMSVFRE